MIRLGLIRREHTELLNLALERDVKSATELIEVHILTPVAIIKKRYFSCQI
jgi:DNA-binding GntR family transcriptional regulator